MFHGFMTLYTSDGVLRTIPIDIDIFPELYTQFIYVGIGVFFSFIIRLFRIRKESIEYTVVVVERAEKAADSSRKQGRFDNEYERADLDFTRGANFINIGDYEHATKLFESSIEHYHNADAGGSNPIQRQILTAEQMAQIVDSIRMRKGFFRFLTKSNNISFIVLSILLSAAIMDAWTRFFPQLVSSSTAGLWPVSALLIGYASQSILGEALELIGRKR